MVLPQVRTSTTDVFIDNVAKATDMLEGFSDSGLRSDKLRKLGKTLEKFVLKQDTSSGVPFRHIKLGNVIPIFLHCQKLSTANPDISLDVVGILASKGQN